MTKNKSMIVYTISIFCIIIWPLLNSFFGLDMVDTGYYLTQYNSPISQYTVLTTFLASFVGAGWLEFFDSLGLWGLNLLEIILEWCQCILVYFTFKDLFGPKKTLIGCSICMIIISTYVNIFNYHQLNMFLSTLLLCLMYKGLEKNNDVYVFLSGVVGMLSVSNRMPSILSFICVLCILYWGCFVKKNIKRSLHLSLYYLLGFLVGALFIFFILYVIGLIKNQDLVSRYFYEVLRINNLGKSGGAAYGTSSMFNNFIIDNINSIKSVFIFSLGIVLLCLYKNWSSFRNNFIIICGCYIFSGIIFIMSLYTIFLMPNAPDFIQLTGFNWFVYGLSLVITLYYIVRGALDEKYSIDGMILMMSMALILLCCIGSATRLKHTILGLWIIIPFCINKCYQIYFIDNTCYKFRNITYNIHKNTHRFFIRYCLLILTFTIFIFVSVSNNFDSINRFSLKYPIDSEKIKKIYTTEGKSLAINSVLNELDQCSSEKTLMVVGNSVIFYYLTNMEPYVKPWVTGTSYLREDLINHLTNEINAKYKSLPIIIWGKTNTYLDFSKEDYEAQIKTEQQNNYSGKKDVINNFMNYFDYNKIFENDYFIIYDTEINIKEFRK